MREVTVTALVNYATKVLIFGTSTRVLLANNAYAQHCPVINMHNADETDMPRENATDVLISISNFISASCF